jgi:hypothetical protein
MTTQLVQGPLRKTTAVMAWLLLGCVLTGQAHAQWEVVDTTAIASNEKGQAQQLGQLVTEYQQLVTQYTSMLSSIGSLQNIGLSSISNSQMAIITDPSSLVAQNCPSATDPVGMVVGALGLDAMSMTANIQASQNKICQQITMLQIHKYNTVAQVLNEMNSYFSTLTSLNDKAGEIVGAVTNAVGDREALGNQQSQAQAALAAKIANVQGQLSADDAAISTLQAQQSMLGNIAIKGSNSMIGNAMQSVVFAGALSD